MKISGKDPSLKVIVYVVPGGFDAVPLILKVLTAGKHCSTVDPAEHPNNIPGLLP